MSVENQGFWPKISLVLPTLNQSAYIEETIKSIIDQKYKNLEFIILDGGSTDGSIEIIKKYADKLAYWQSKPDKGQTDALIQGFERATGEILGWVNSDDVLFPGALEKIAGAYKNNPDIGIFAGNYVIIDTQGKIIRIKRHPREYEWFGKHGLQVISPEWFFTREAYNVSGGLDKNLNYAMDLDLFMKMIMRGVHCKYIDSDLLGFRFHPGSKTVAQKHGFYNDSLHVARWLEEKNQVKLVIISNNDRLNKNKYGIAPFRSNYYWVNRIYQILNGNYLKMFTKTLRFKGMNWRHYSQIR